jgi:hypothetical protein
MKLLRLTAEPMCTKSKTDKLLPIDTFPNTDSMLFNLLNPRKLKTDPMWKQSRTERELPNVATPYTLNRCCGPLTKDLTLAQDPLWKKSKTDNPEQTLTGFRMLNVDPILATPRTLIELPNFNC